MNAEKEILTLKARVSLQETEEHRLPDVLPEVMVHAFDRNGELLTSVSLPKTEDGYGQATLKLSATLKGQSVRLVLGPPIEDVFDDVPPWMEKLLSKSEGESESPRVQAAGAARVTRVPRVASLTRRGGIERSVRSVKDKLQANIVLQHPDWVKWLKCQCVVRGRLIKRIELPDGTSRDLGVCHACVKIYEVDAFPRFVMRLPETQLYRLRDELLDASRIRFAEPPRELEPNVEDRFPPPSPPPPETMASFGPMRASDSPTNIRSDTGKFSLQSELSVQRADLRSIRQRSDLEAVLNVGSATALRAAMIAEADLLVRYLCYIPWLYHWFHKDLVKCTCTDEQGRFETNIWYTCSGDKPDLYFKAVQCIGGDLHILYDPGVVCNTYWNYECGTDVVLTTDDPAAIVCEPEPDVDVPSGVSLWVMPFKVGNISLDNINSDGRTNFSAWNDVPFGGRLGFRLGHSTAIPINTPNSPFYYRWQYNKLTEEGAETTWREFATPVAQTVVRHFIDEIEAHPEIPPTFPTYTLGPKSDEHGMHLYEFKPHEPPELAGHIRQWPTDSWFGDIYSGILSSESLPGGVASAAGKYKIRLEVFDSDGNVVVPDHYDEFDNPVAGAFTFIVPDGMDTDGETTLSRVASPSEIEKIMEGGTDYYGFVFHLHMDNNHCQAEIYDASVDGVEAGACGFISYTTGDDTHLSFRAYHPNGFARFKFIVVKGSSGYVNVACAPLTPSVAWVHAPLVTDSPVNGFTRSVTSVFEKDVPVTQMLGDCPQAAFGENLYVEATATNGWRRLDELDAYALPKAFALEPTED